MWPLRVDFSLGNKNKSQGANQVTGEFGGCVTIIGIFLDAENSNL